MSDLRITIAQDLSSIAEMFVKLRSEAVNRAGDPEFPGGAAMVMLGPGADIEAWGYVQMSAMLGRLRVDKKETARILKEDLEPPLSFLASWADIVREHRGQEPGRRRATIAHEVGYLRSSLDWMLAVNEDGEPWFIQVEDFATRLGQVRQAMEGVLFEGKRLTRIRARCMYCEQAPRLAREYVDGEKDDTKDYWFCPDPKCPAEYDAAGVQRCHDHRLRAEGGNGWVTLTDAAKSLKRPIKTLRTWVNTPAPYATILPSRRNPRSGRIEVEWSAALATDDTKARRNRGAESYAVVLSSA